MSWVNLNEAIGLRHCCAQGYIDEENTSDEGFVAIENGSSAIVNIPLGTWITRSDEDLYQFSEEGVMVTEAGLYLISGSVYYVNADVSVTRGAYIRTNNNTELSQAYYYEQNTTTAGAVGLAPKVVSLSAGTVLYLSGRAYNKQEEPNDNPKIYKQNLATFLTIVKVA